MGIYLQKNKQKGLSLIELLIAAVIGLFLLSGIASSYIASKKASISRNQLSILEDNGRFALEAITKSLEHTGYAPNILMTDPFIHAPADVVIDNCPGGSTNISASSQANFTTARVTKDDDTNIQDSIGAIFHGSNDIFIDCTGNPLPAGVPGCRLQALPAININPDSAKIYNSFFIDNTTKKLMCAGSRSSTLATIAEGVENMQFLYGLDTNTDGIVDRYATATAIDAVATDSLDWGGVISIQVSILVRSLKPVKNKAEIKKFTLLDQVVTTPNDKYQRAVFSTTILLRNTL